MPSDVVIRNLIAENWVGRLAAAECGEGSGTLYPLNPKCETVIARVDPRDEPLLNCGA